MNTPLETAAIPWPQVEDAFLIGVGFRVWGLGFRVWGLGFGGSGLAFSCCGAMGSGFTRSFHKQEDPNVERKDMLILIIGIPQDSSSNFLKTQNQNQALEEELFP